MPSAPREVLRPELEAQRLEHAHHELCTSLTVIRSNLELAWISLRREERPSATSTLVDHLGEMEASAERLMRLVEELRAWRAGLEASLDAETRNVPKEDGSLHPYVAT